MAIPSAPGPPKPKSSGGGGSSSSRGGSRSGGSSGGGGSTSSSSSSGGSSAPEPKTNAQRHAERAAKSKGAKTKKGVKVFGQPITVAEYRQLRQRYNDIARSWLGRNLRESELRRIINRGVSDYQLRLQMTRKKAFRRSPMYRTLQRQASDIVGLNYSPSPSEIRQALRSEGGLSADSYRAALMRSGRAQRRVTQDFNRSGQRREYDFALGAFGQGELSGKQARAIAMQQSGLKETTMGRRLESAFQQAMERMQRTFQGSVATSQTSPTNLQAQNLRQDDEDLPA